MVTETERIKYLIEKVEGLAKRIQRDSNSLQQLFPQFLSSQEMCDIFGLSARTLQNYRDTGQIPYTTIGGKLLYPVDDIIQLLKRNYKPIRSKQPEWE